MVAGIYLNINFPVKNQLNKIGDNSSVRSFFPQLSSSSDEPYSPFPLSNNLPSFSSDKISISPATKKLLQDNNELLRIIGGDEDLKNILENSEGIIKKTAENGIFLATENLENVIVQGAVNKLGDNNPITESFLSDNIGLAKSSPLISAVLPRP